MYTVTCVIRYSKRSYFVFFVPHFRFKKNVYSYVNEELYALLTIHLPKTGCLKVFRAFYMGRYLDGMQVDWLGLLACVYNDTYDATIIIICLSKLIS